MVMPHLTATVVISVLRQDGDRHEATTATKAQHTVLFFTLELFFCTHTKVFQSVFQLSGVEKGGGAQFQQRG